MINVRHWLQTILIISLSLFYGFSSSKNYIERKNPESSILQCPNDKKGMTESVSVYDYHPALSEAIHMYTPNHLKDVKFENTQKYISFINTKQEINKSDTLPLYLNRACPVDKRVEDLLSRMTLQEKLGQLNAPIPNKLAKDLSGRMDACRKFAEGKLISNIGPAGGFWAPANMIKEGVKSQAEFLNELQKIATENTRLKIPLIFFEEGTHGLVTPGATIFPEGLAIGSTWNIGLIKNIYAVVGKEGRSRGVHFLGTLVIEPIRDPRLGRNEEGYSEDPYMCSKIAEAIVYGMQGDDVSANDKAISLLCHFPGQSEPLSGLERGAMEISERKLREVFLPPWKAGIKAGALGIMATYPTIDDEVTHGSEKLLTKILRNELSFNGLVMCEGAGLEILIYEKIVSSMKEAGELCLKAGVDVSIWHEDGYMNDMHENVLEGKVAIETVDRSVRRILKVKFLLGLFENPFVDVEKAINEYNTKESRNLALQAAREGIVLLKNEKNLLPLKKNIRSVAVIGPNADAKRNQLGDYTHHPIFQDVVTVLEGIKNKVSPQTRINYVKGCEIIGNKLNEIKKAANIAKKSDVAIVVVGENGEVTNGEGNDVASLDLTGMQEELLKAIHATGTPTIAVLINGRALSICWTSENIPAIIEAWMCGEEGGNAVADVLFGDYNPSGRLPVTFPRHSGQLPVYYNYKPSKEYWIKHGWRTAYVDMSPMPLYPFGYGLSYTTFEYSNLQITPKEIGPAGEVKVTLDVQNTGKKEGAEVVQLYINDIISSMSRPVKELKGFEKVNLEPGEKKTIIFKLGPEHLSFLNRYLEPVVEPGLFKVMVGSSSEDIHLNGEFLVK